PGLGQSERIGYASFSLLIGKAELLQAELLAVLQQTKKIAGVLPAGHDQNVANACIHQGLQGIEDHRFVIHGQQVLVGNAGQRIQARTDATRQDYSLHQLSVLNAVNSASAYDRLRRRLSCQIPEKHAGAREDELFSNRIMKIISESRPAWQAVAGFASPAA